MNTFLQEELALMGNYEHADRMQLLQELEEALPYMEDLVAADLMLGCRDKLRGMTNQAFAAFRDELENPELF